MSYKFIQDPVSKNVYSIYSELGRNLLKSYISQVGGADEDILEDELPEAELEGEAPKDETELEAPVESEVVEEDNNPTKVEDKSWARFKSQWLIWIGNRFKEMGDLFNSVGNSQQPVEEQTGGNGNEYLHKVLTLIV